MLAASGADESAWVPDTYTLSYESPGQDWTLGLYGRNVTDERYDNARLNTGDYILVILSNDASEFGVRYTNRFR